MYLHSTPRLFLGLRGGLLACGFLGAREPLISHASRRLLRRLKVTQLRATLAGLHVTVTPPLRRGAVSRLRLLLSRLNRVAQLHPPALRRRTFRRSLLNVVVRPELRGRPGSRRRALLSRLLRHLRGGSRSDGVGVGAHLDGLHLRLRLLCIVVVVRLLCG